MAAWVARHHPSHFNICSRPIKENTESYAFLARKKSLYHSHPPCTKLCAWMRSQYPGTSRQSGLISGCVFEVWPAPGARESLPKGEGLRPPHFGRLSQAPGAGKTSNMHPQKSGQTAFRYPEYCDRFGCRLSPQFWEATLGRVLRTGRGDRTGYRVLPFLWCFVFCFV